MSPARTRLPRVNTTAGLVGIAVVIVMAVLPLLAINIPLVFPAPSYMPGTLSMLALCMVFAALALSYNLLLGTAGMLSFGHALSFGAGAYLLGIVLAELELALPVAIILSLVGGLAIALVTGSIANRVGEIPFAMVTLAFAQAGSVLVRRNAHITGGEEGLSVNTAQVPDVLVGVTNTRNLYWMILALLVVVYLVVLWVDKSHLGHVARATRDNEQRVRVLGLSPYRAKLIVFVIASLLASVSGMAYMLLQSGTTPRAVSSDLTITVLVMVVLGGVGYRWGAVAGGVIYTLLDQRLTVLAKADVISTMPDVLRIPLSEPMFILGVLFILVVMFLPGGIAGTAATFAQRRRHRISQPRGLDALDHSEFADPADPMDKHPV